MYLGIDIGSVSTDAVILNEKSEIVAKEVMRSGYNQRETVKQIIELCCEDVGITKEQIQYVVSTGYGRKNVECANQCVTEISCHAMGIHFLKEDIGTVIDIGGQDSKVIQLSDCGMIENFAMNDKCAAGTGRFLENMSHVLNISINEMGDIAVAARKSASISSVCTVFAESEVISKISDGVPFEEIVSGIHDSISERIIGLLYSVGMKGKIGMTGGVAKNKGMVHKISKKLNCEIFVPEEPQIIGALGAALFARNISLKEKS